MRVLRVSCWRGRCVPYTYTHLQTSAHIYKCLHTSTLPQALGAGIGVKCAVLVGGIDMMAQAIALARRPHVIVGTPGRVVDHLSNTKVCGCDEWVCGCDECVGGCMGGCGWVRDGGVGVCMGLLMHMEYMWYVCIAAVCRSHTVVIQQQVQQTTTPDIHTPIQGFHLRDLKHLVLDEADRLLNMDFEQEIDQILRAIPKVCWVVSGEGVFLRGVVLLLVLGVCSVAWWCLVEWCCMVFVLCIWHATQRHGLFSTHVHYHTYPTHTQRTPNTTLQDRQTQLFSATMTSKVAKLQRACLKDPVKVEVASKYTTVETLRQQYLFVPAKHKVRVVVWFVCLFCVCVRGVCVSGILCVRCSPQHTYRNTPQKPQKHVHDTIPSTTSSTIQNTHTHTHTHTHITQDVYLAYALTELSGSTSMIFTRTCDNTRRISLMLRNLGFGAVPIHGQMGQPKRLAALNKFKVGWGGV